MKTRIIISALIILIVAFLFRVSVRKTDRKNFSNEKSLFENEEQQAAYQYLRWKYDADMIKDPVTGEIPMGMRDQEIEFAKTIPVRSTISSSNNSRVLVQNSYLPAGPNNIGGRTRAIAYDVRYNGTSNRVILAGSVSGGIYRSADGGANWTRVSPANEVHNLSSLAQDPRVGSQDTWYAGGGEYIGSSTDGTGAGYLAHGLFKSTDNGLTWIRLSLSNITDQTGAAIPAGVAERFDHPFDYVHKIAINPVNGNVYVAAHRRIVRSSDGGNTFQVIFGSATAFAANGQSDVAISPTDRKSVV